MNTLETNWLGTRGAANRLGVTPRTLYRLIDVGAVPAYKFGRVIRLKADDVDAFITASQITPGDLKHLHPETASAAAAADDVDAAHS